MRHPESMPAGAPHAEPDESALSPLVAASWSRSRAFGVDPALASPRRVDDLELVTRLEASGDLIAAAAPHLEWLVVQLGALQHVAILTDAQGVVLYATGNAPEGMHAGGLLTGSVISEEEVGTNAAGTALAVGRVVAIRGRHHFCQAFAVGAGTAAPVRDPDGRLAGAIELATLSDDTRAEHAAAIGHVAYAVSRELAGMREHRRAEEATRRTAALQAFTAALSRAQSIQEVASLSVDLGVGTIVARAGMLSLFTEDERALEMVAQVGFSRESAEYLGRLPADGHSGAAEAARTGEAVFIETEGEWRTRYPDIAGKSGAVGGARAIVPVRVNGKVLGTLALILPAWTPLSAEDRAFVRSLADQCAQALDRAMLTERSHQQRAMVAIAAAQEELLSIAAHDLRSPLSALRLQLELVRRAISSPKGPRLEQASELIDRATRTVNRTAALVGDLLDAGRADTGRLDVTPTDADLVAVLDDLLARMREQFEDSGCALRFEAPEPVVGRWHRIRLEQVFGNLLANAMKYGQGAPIEVRVTADEARARVDVTDHGHGLSEGVLGLIFERHQRATTDPGRKGYGLGLWIVRRIVDALGGKITVSSRPGEGTTFTVTLPLMGPEA